MAGFLKRLLWSVALAFLVLLGALFWTYRGTRLTLRRAESFQFWRILSHVLDIDTLVNRTRNFHNFSLETPEFFDDLFLQLANPVTPHNRLRYPAETPDGVVYWILTRGR